MTWPNIESIGIIIYIIAWNVEICLDKGEIYR